MNSTSKLLFALLLTAWPVTSAHAFVTFAECNGSPPLLKDDVVVFVDPSANFADVSAAVQGWNELPGVSDRFSLVKCGSACYQQADLFPDVRQVDSMLVGDAWAVNWVRQRPCAAPYDEDNDGHIFDFDIELTTSHPARVGDDGVCDSFAVYARSVYMHEFGHALGLDHENSYISLMNGNGFEPNFSTPGKYCGQATIAPHPDEVDFMYGYYATGGSSVDGALLGYYLNTDGNIVPTRSSKHQDVCPVDTVTYKFTWANRGSETIPWTDVTTVLSLDNVIDLSDRVVDSDQVWGTRGFDSTAIWNFTVPKNLGIGIYKIGVIFDPSNTVDELFEGNNATYLAGTIGSTGCPAIKSLSVKDTANASKWSLQVRPANIKAGILAYGDDTTIKWSSVPTALAGKVWLRTANASKSYTGSTLATFKVSFDTNVYVCHKDKIVPRPSWLGSWTDTNLDLKESSETSLMSCFKKFFPYGSTVSLGNNGKATFNMYTVILELLNN